jgi:hypothetical protein
MGSTRILVCGVGKRKKKHKNMKEGRASKLGTTKNG